MLFNCLSRESSCVTEAFDFSKIQTELFWQDQLNTRPTESVEQMDDQHDRAKPCPQVVLPGVLA